MRRTRDFFSSSRRVCLAGEGTDEEGGARNEVNNNDDDDDDDHDDNDDDEDESESRLRIASGLTGEGSPT